MAVFGSEVVKVVLYSPMSYAEGIEVRNNSDGDEAEVSHAFTKTVILVHKTCKEVKANGLV